MLANTANIISQVACPPTPQNFSMVASDVLIVMKKAVTETHILDSKECIVSLCLVKGRNYSLKHHSYAKTTKILI